MRSLNPNLSENEMVWLVSLYYNAWNNNKTISYVERWDLNSIKYIMNKHYKWKWTKYERWLTKRRDIEIAIIEGVWIF